MKKVTSFITLLFLTATGLFAQDQTSGSTNSLGSNRWSDTGYAKRNRVTYDSLLKMHQGYWNEDSDIKFGVPEIPFGHMAEQNG